MMKRVLASAVSACVMLGSLPAMAQDAPGDPFEIATAMGACGDGEVESARWEDMSYKKIIVTCEDDNGLGYVAAGVGALLLLGLAQGDDDNGSTSGTD